MFEMFLFLVFLIAIFVVFVSINSYNTLQHLAQFVKETRSNITVSLKKRQELANKLIDIAQGYAGHEKLVQLKVSQDAADASIVSSYQQTNVSLAQVGAVAEKFPALKADGTYRQLMADLQTIEADLQSKRETYNASCRRFNTSRNSIPSVFIATRLGFGEAPYLDLDATADLDIVKDFVTDDGAMLQKLISGAGQDALSKSIEITRQITSISGQLLQQGLSHGKADQLYLYININNLRGGPVKLDELVQLYHDGLLNDDSLISILGVDEWRPYSKIVSSLAPSVSKD